MSSHLSFTQLNALVDGESTADELESNQTHLNECSSCTARALEQALLKTAVARAGQRYVTPPDFQDRISRALAQEQIAMSAAARSATQIKASPSGQGRRFFTWAGAAAALVLLIMATPALRLRQSDQSSVTASAFLTELSDQHIAALAGNLPPQVISSDRHTVKPWFAGKLPFSFNIPENLPADTKLDGGNFTYIQISPPPNCSTAWGGIVSQSLFSRGRLPAAGLHLSQNARAFTWLQVKPET